MKLILGDDEEPTLGRYIKDCFKVNNKKAKLQLYL